MFQGITLNPLWLHEQSNGVKGELQSKFLKIFLNNISLQISPSFHLHDQTNVQLTNCSVCLLDFPVREVHCDARAETEWEKLAQNLQLKVGLQLDPPQKQKLT